MSDENATRQPTTISPQQAAGQGTSQSASSSATSTPTGAPESNPLATVATAFEANIAALRHFAENIGPLADQQDEHNLTSWVTDLFKTIDVHLDWTGEKPVAKVTGTSLDGHASDVDSWIEGDDSPLDKHMRSSLADPQKLQHFTRTARTFKPAASRAGGVFVEAAS